MSNEQDASILRDARRYRRLQILGAAPGGSRQLDNSTVLCFTNLDAFVDADLKLHPSRGEAHPVADAHPEEPQDVQRGSLCRFTEPRQPRPCFQVHPMDHTQWCGACLMEAYDPERFKVEVEKILRAKEK